MSPSCTSGKTTASGRLLLPAGREWTALKEKLAGLGLPVADPVNDNRPVIEATYDYRDEAGRLTYQVVRYPPKDFRQRRPDGSGGWVWNMKKNTPRLLFRLPELIEAIATGQTIYVTEGEKDALDIVAAGGVATCNSGVPASGELSTMLTSSAPTSSSSPTRTNRGAGM